MIQILKTQYLTQIIVRIMLAIQKIIQKKVSRMKSQSLKILKLKIRKLANDNEEKYLRLYAEFEIINVEFKRKSN